MQFNTTRFGSVAFGEEQVVTFREGLPGFEHAHRFVFLPHPGENGSPFSWMQCVDDLAEAPALAFPVVSPWLIEPEYAPAIPGSQLRELGIDDLRSQAEVWAIVTIPRDRPSEATVNLLAPVVVNRNALVARQVILTNDEYAAKTSLCGGGEPGMGGKRSANRSPKATVDMPSHRTATAGALA